MQQFCFKRNSYCGPVKNYDNITGVKIHNAALFFVHIINFAAMPDISVNIVNTSSNQLPAYATAGSAGMDIRANLTETVLLQPLERILVPTGLFIELPEGYEAQVRPRSGLAINQGITCLNSPGTIDSDYRGEVKVILINLSAEAQQIKHGDRIAQILFGKVERAALHLVEQLGHTERGEGGFGHTGKH
jgi:dUTP pyrophosphatase